MSALPASDRFARFYFVLRATVFEDKSSDIVKVKIAVPYVEPRKRTYQHRGTPSVLGLPDNQSFPTEIDLDLGHKNS